MWFAAWRRAKRAYRGLLSVAERSTRVEGGSVVGAVGTVVLSVPLHGRSALVVGTLGDAGLVQIRGGVGVFVTLGGAGLVGTLGGDAWGLCAAKMVASSRRASIWRLPSWANGAAGARCCKACTKSVAAWVAASADDVCGMLC